MDTLPINNNSAIPIPISDTRIPLIYRLTLRGSLLDITFDAPTPTLSIHTILVTENGFFRSADIDYLSSLNLQYAVSIHSMDLPFTSNETPLVRGRKTINIQFNNQLPKDLGPFYITITPTITNTNALLPSDDTTNIPTDPLFRLIPLTIGPLNSLLSTTTTDINLYRPIPLPNNTNPLLIQEQWDAGIPGKNWDSAFHFLHFFQHHFRSKNTYPIICDLSSATGLIGLYLSHTKLIPGNTDIVITDLPESLSLIHSNAALNKPSSTNIHILPCDWSKPPPPILLNNCDMIIASDVFYDPSVFGLLFPLFKRMLNASNKDSCILVGYKSRGGLLELLKEGEDNDGEYGIVLRAFKNEGFKLVQEWMWDTGVRIWMFGLIV